MDNKPEYSPTEKEAPANVGEVYHQSSDYGAETELKRLLSTRHVTMIALGSSIGMGLWLGSGKSLASGGPAGIFLGYVLAGSMIWSVSHSIGEMAVMYPLPSAFVQWVWYAPLYSSLYANEISRLESLYALPLLSPLAGRIGSHTLSRSRTNSRLYVPCLVSGRIRCPLQRGSPSSGSLLSRSTYLESTFSAK
jgi:hypothetical protein